MAPFSSLDYAPLFPAPRGGDGLISPIFQKVPSSLRRGAAVAANLLIICLKALVHGDIPTVAEPALGSYGKWAKSGKTSRAVSERLLEAVVLDYVETGDFLTGEVRGSYDSDRADFRRLTSKAREAYPSPSRGGRGSASVKENPRLPRGALADGPLSELALPPSHLRGRRAAELSDEVASFFLQNPELMVRPKGPEDAEKFRTTRTFWSSSYRTREQRLELALALFVAGMIGFTDRVKCYTSLFTVIKKVSSRWYSRVASSLGCSPDKSALGRSTMVRNGEPGMSGKFGPFTPGAFRQTRNHYRRPSTLFLYASGRALDVPLFSFWRGSLPRI